MATIFDGLAFSVEKIEALKIVTSGLKSRGIIPHLASILIGNDEASRLYVSLKKKAAEKVGAEFDPYFLPKWTKLSDVVSLIESLNIDKNINGIMVQLPIPGNLSKEKEKIINSIDPKKDVDGLRSDSTFLHPTSRAVIDILENALLDVEIKNPPVKICVVGATGMVGTPLVKELKKEGYNVTEANAKTVDLSEKTVLADVVISATGVPGIIKTDMVKDGVIIIDVGSPHGDVDGEVEKKSAFFTPVPGGVGPVTVSCLLENLIETC